MRIFTLIAASFLMLGNTSVWGQEAGGADDEATKLVRTAFEHELARDEDLRDEFLRRARELDPQNEASHWQAGFVRTKDGWVRVEDAQRAAAEDPQLAEYNRLRLEQGGNLAGEIALAKWCRRRDMPDEERMHWLNVVRIQPNHEAALRRLKLQWHDGQLKTREQIVADKKRVKQTQELREEIRDKWEPLAKRWRALLEQEESPERTAALRELRAVSDPAALPFLERELANLNADVAKELVRVAGSLPSPYGVWALLRNGLQTPFPEVEREVIAQLKQHDIYAFVPSLLSELRMPIETDFGIFMAPDGTVHYRHELYQQGALQDTSRTILHSEYQHDLLGPYSTIVVSRLNPDFSFTRRTDWNRLQATKAAKAQRNQRQAVSKATRLQQQVKRYNAVVARSNQRIQRILAATCDVQHEDAGAWWQWWIDYNEVYTPDEKYIDHQQLTSSWHTVYRPKIRAASCFARGTPVWTRTGLRPIESIQVGDMVYAQDPNTGELALKRVLGTTIRPPSETRRLYVGEEAIETTLGHPFWLSGSGWKMAKFLEDGSVIRTVHGSKPIDHVEKGIGQAAHNLVVADFHCYFVGQAGLLVHDNLMRQPTDAVLPGYVR